MEQERAVLPSTEKKYTERDMLAAFYHGREYESFHSDKDVNTTSMPEKNRPFWGWLRVRDEQQNS